MARAEQETPTNPVLADLMAPFAAFWDTVRDGLARGWDGADTLDPLLVAAIGHALAFSTWNSLVQQGLDDNQAADLMHAMVRCAPRSADPRRQS